METLRWSLNRARPCEVAREGRGRVVAVSRGAAVEGCREGCAAAARRGGAVGGCRLRSAPVCRAAAAGQRGRLVSTMICGTKYLFHNDSFQAFIY